MVYIQNPIKQSQKGTTSGPMGRGTLGDIDPFNRVPFKGIRRRVKKGPLYEVALMLPR